MDDSSRLVDVVVVVFCVRSELFIAAGSSRGVVVDGGWWMVDDGVSDENNGWAGR